MKRVTSAKVTFLPRAASSTDKPTRTCQALLPRLQPRRALKGQPSLRASCRHGSASVMTEVQPDFSPFIPVLVSLQVITEITLPNSFLHILSISDISADSTYNWKEISVPHLPPQEAVIRVK